MMSSGNMRAGRLSLVISLFLLSPICLTSVSGDVDDEQLQDTYTHSSCVKQCLPFVLLA